MSNKRTLQIDVKKEVSDGIMECVLCFDGYSTYMYISRSDYETLKKENFFIRDGKSLDSANVMNTTNVFYEEII